MLHRFIVAIGAGCAAALLFVVSAQSSVLAMALAYLAPLPIMIATLGWGLDAGAIAGAISVAALALLCRTVVRVAVRRFGRRSRLGPGRVRDHPVARYLGGQRPGAPSIPRSAPSSRSHR